MIQRYGIDMRRPDHDAVATDLGTFSHLFAHSQPEAAFSRAVSIISGANRASRREVIASCRIVAFIAGSDKVGEDYKRTAASWLDQLAKSSSESDPDIGREASAALLALDERRYSVHRKIRALLEAEADRRSGASRPEICAAVRARIISAAARPNNPTRTSATAPEPVHPPAEVAATVPGPGPARPGSYDVPLAGRRLVEFGIWDRTLSIRPKASALYCSRIETSGGRSAQAFVVSLRSSCLR